MAIRWVDQPAGGDQPQPAQQGRIRWLDEQPPQPQGPPVPPELQQGPPMPALQMGDVNTPGLITQAPDQATQADIAKSAASGAARTVVGAPGMIGSLVGGLGDLYSKLHTSSLYGENPEDIAPIVNAPKQNPALFTSEDVIKGASKLGVPGLDYSPQTTPGEVARTVGEALPTAVLPGMGATTAARVANAVIPALSSEAAGQVAREVAPEWEGPARLAAGLAAGIGTGMATPSGAETAASKAAGARAAAADEFKIPLTEGQATGDVTKTAQEESMRNAAKGAPAQQAMQDFEAVQNARVQAAHERIASDLAPKDPVTGQPIAAAQAGAAAQTPAEAGQVLQDALKAHADDLRAQSQAAFKRMEDAGVTVQAAAARPLKDELTQAVLKEGHNVTGPNAGSYPATRQALELVDQKLNIMAQRTPGQAMKEIPLADISDMRQRINAIGANPLDRPDVSALSALKKRFDQWTTDTVAGPHLVHPDPAVAAQARVDLTNANKLWSQYRGLTNPRGVGGQVASDSQKLVAKIVNGEHTPEEVGNWLFGSAAVGTTGRAARVATAVKQQLGEQSPAFQAIRQAVWKRATTPTAGSGGPQALAKNMGKFVGEDNALARAVFSPEERATMQRLQAVHQTMIPPLRGTNPPKTAHTLGRMGREMMAPIGAAIGAHALGGIPGTVLGLAGGKLAKEGSDVLNAARATRATITPPSASGTARWGFTPARQFAKTPGRYGGLAQPLIELQRQYGGQ